MLTPAICTQCGGKIEVDASLEAGICKFCGTAFITEKVINNYVTNHSTVHNVTENVTKIIYGNEKDEGSDFFKRGTTMLKLSKFKDARKAFKKACSLSPEKAIYWFYLAAAHTESFTSVERGFDNEEDSSEYGLTLCFEALDSFFALATDKEKAQLSEEFGINLAGGPSFVLAKLFENLKGSDVFLSGSCYDLLNFMSKEYGKEENIKLMKTPEAANAIADLIMSSKFDWRVAHIVPVICNICLEYMDEEKATSIKDRFVTVVNPIYNGRLDIENPDFLKDGEYVDGVLRISRPDVTEIFYKPKENLKKLIITDNLTGPCTAKADVVEFEGAPSDDVVVNAIFNIAQEMVILPSSCSGISRYIGGKDGMSLSLIICSKSNFKNGIIFCKTKYDGTAIRCRHGSVINGKITYPAHPDEYVVKNFNENLLKYFGKEIKSGEITGYSENPSPSLVGGCYVATCAYGSYDCPQVWTLRRYRDLKLRKTPFGRLFIKIYYAISPKVVELFGKYAWFNRFFKKRLDKMVHRLEKKGFENTPYVD